MEKNTGGPALVRLTVRDEFALGALQGLLAMQASPALAERSAAYFDHGRADLLAKDAYVLADAMLAARSL